MSRACILLFCLLALGLACALPSPGPVAEPWIGKWEPAGPGEVCLRLDADGRFELTRRGDEYGAEVVLTGTYTLAGTTLRVTPTEIHAERWVSRCRKHVTSEGPLKTYELLGATFALATEAVVSFELNDDHLRICGADTKRAWECAELTRVDE